MNGYDFAQLIRGDLRQEETIETLLLYANTEAETLTTELNVRLLGRRYFQKTIERSTVQGERQYEFPEEVINGVQNIWLQDVKLLPLDTVYRGEVSRDDSDGIEKAFQGLQPAFEIIGNSVFVYSSNPIIAETNALRLDVPVKVIKLIEEHLDEGVAYDLSNIPIPDGIIASRVPVEAHDLWQKRVSVRISKSRGQEPPFQFVELQNLFEITINKMRQRSQGGGAIDMNYTHLNNYDY